MALVELSVVEQRYRAVLAVLAGEAVVEVAAHHQVSRQSVHTWVSEGVRLARGRRAGIAMELPSPAQVRALLDAADSPFRTFVALCAFAGLRLGEAAAVQVGDFDLPGRRLEVSRQVQRVNGGDVDIRAPKYGSERTVYLADGLITVARAHIAGLPGSGRERWLFRGEKSIHRIKTLWATGGARPATAPDAAP